MASNFAYDKMDVDCGTWYLVVDISLGVVVSVDLPIPLYV